MRQLSNAEERLWAQVTAQDQASLMQIRLAVEKAWAPDAPRLVRNFTDHGPEHCQRLAGYVERLLDASTGETLDEVETYTLLAAIYLHDVGMQCDIPEVQTGCNVVTNPGCLIGKRTLIYSNTSLRKGYYPPNRIVKLRQTLDVVERW